jgi:hypothetical protein
LRWFIDFKLPIGGMKQTQWLLISCIVNGVRSGWIHGRIAKSLVLLSGVVRLVMQTEQNLINIIAIVAIAIILLSVIMVGGVVEGFGVNGDVVISLNHA